MGSQCRSGHSGGQSQPSCSYTFQWDDDVGSLLSTCRHSLGVHKHVHFFASLRLGAISKLLGQRDVSGVGGKGSLKKRKKKKRKGGDQFVPLPVGILQGGRAKRYAWNGHHIQAVEPDVLVNGETGLDTIKSRLWNLKHTISEAFFPNKEAVNPDYWEYVGWRAGHRLCSAMVNNFATQSLLAAVGVGAQKQLPAAATINWLLKDGLGRLGRLSVAASFGQSFDSDLKRFRWLTSLVFSSSIALEYLTPLMPRHFLLLASLSNIGKSVGVTTYVATHPAFQRSFARGENLADINAKGQAQQMVMDTLGLALCVGLTYAVRNNARGRLLLPLLAFPVLGAGDLFCIFHELKATHLRTLNRERAEMVAERWVADGTIFTAREVSDQERLLLPSQVGGGAFPLHFAPLEDAIDSPEELGTLLARHRGQRFLMAYHDEDYRSRSLFSRKVHGHLAVTLEVGATTEQILTAVLQAAIFRKLLAQPLPAPTPPVTLSAAEIAATEDTSSLSRSHAKIASVGAAVEGGVPTTLVRREKGTRGGRGWDWEEFRQRLCDAQAGVHGDALMEGSASTRKGVKGVRWLWTVPDHVRAERAMVRAAELAKQAAPAFVTDLVEGCWQTDPFMISSTEKAGFVQLPVDK